MRLAVLMSLASPWAREAALQLTTLGHGVHVIDFARPVANDGYLHARDHGQAFSISDLRQAVAGVHLMTPLFSSGLSYVLSVPRLREILKECRPDVLLTLYGGGQAVMAYLSGFRPYAVYTVGSDVLMAAGIKRRVSRAVLQAADLVLANGVYLAQKTSELAPAARLLPLYLGVNTDVYASGERRDSPVKIVCTRGFLPVYNNEYLVRGIAAMPHGGPEFTVTFVSCGPLLPQVKAAADALLPDEVRSRVEFLEGVPCECLVERLQQAHIYVSMSRSDGTSISLLEALSCGLFPVLSDIPQNREWIDPDSCNGILVPLDNPSALATALAQAIADQDLRRRAAAFNRRRVLEQADSRQSMTVLASRLSSLTACPITGA